MKITKVNASFSMKKSLGNYEMADIFFAAEAEVGKKDRAETIAKKVHDFCKKLAVDKYNSFSRTDLTGTPSTVEYEKGFRAGLKEGVKEAKRLSKPDPNERKEAMAEMSMDAKSENTLDPY